MTVIDWSEDFSGDLSEELDRIALAYPNPRPLKRDPRLWELLAPYRDENIKACANEECGRLMRPHNRDREDYPGCADPGARGLCLACYKRARRNGTAGESRKPMPSHCRMCGEPVRPHHSTREQFPGAKRYHGRGICNSCHTSKRRAS